MDIVEQNITEGIEYSMGTIGGGGGESWGEGLLPLFHLWEHYLPLSLSR